jgi:hypothetical protein
MTPVDLGGLRGCRPLCTFWRGLAQECLFGFRLSFESNLADARNSLFHAQATGDMTADVLLGVGRRSAGANTADPSLPTMGREKQSNESPLRHTIPLGTRWLLATQGFEKAEVHDISPSVWLNAVCGKPADTGAGRDARGDSGLLAFLSQKLS